MLPTLSIGPWQISTFVALNAVAFLVAGSLTIRRLLRAGYPTRWITEGIGLMLLAAMSGAVVFFGAVSLAAGEATSLTRSGSSIFGALAAGGAAGLAYARLRGVAAGPGFDAGIVFLPLGQAIGRLGCFLGGCCYGKPSGSWLAATLPDETGVWQPRYPTQLLSAAANLMIFLLLIGFERLRRRRGRGGEWPFAGALTVLFMGLYATKRFSLEFLRDDPPLVWGLFTWAHVTAVGLLLVAAGLAGWRWAAARRESGATDA